ncbi:MAG: PBSX family phage terminase large subunit [Bacilli bacterium]|nr:PBSX family phage terminase large subunit [Bacilli bacterium]
MKWLPFSKKHIDYILNTKNCKANVAEGAVRAGKTIDNCIAFALNLEYTTDKIHLASGSTLANAKLNVGECNGFGLEHQFKGRCHWGKFKDNEALYIQTKTGEKIVIFVGGGKADSYKKILGNSYGFWIATEVNEHYDCEESKESFIKVAFARQLASNNPKWFWDLNPSNPLADIYTKYIDLWAKNGLIGGYNYQHFTIFDNAAITEQRKQEIISQYDPTSIWYQRDILGKRVVAEGLIYREFKDYHIIKMQDWNAIDEKGNYTHPIRKALKFITIGVDFGGNISAHSFNATGFTNQFRKFGTIKQKRIAKRIDDKELIEEFIKFIKELKEEYPGINIIDIRCDSAEQTLIAGFERALRENRLAIPINNAIKGEILNRIRFYCKMFSTNKYFILECCEPLIMAFKTAIWEKDKNDIRLDDGKQDVDSLDGQEYSTEPYQDVLVQIN